MEGPGRGLAAQSASSQKLGAIEAKWHPRWIVHRSFGADAALAVLSRVPVVAALSYFDTDPGLKLRPEPEQVYGVLTEQSSEPKKYQLHCKNPLPTSDVEIPGYELCLGYPLTW